MWGILMLIALPIVLVSLNQGKKMLLAVTALLLAAATVITAVIKNDIKHSNADELLNTQSFTTGETDIPNINEYRTILIAGSDERKNSESYRTDIIILAVINTKANTMNLFTVARDTPVKLPDSEKVVKINEAASVGGGMQALADCIGDSFSIAVDEYIKLDWGNYTAIVDTIFSEGVTVNLNEVERLAMIQPLIEQNKLFGYPSDTDLWEETNSLFSENRYLGEDVLNAMQNTPELFVKGSIGGEPVLYNGERVNLSNKDYVIQKLYDVNNLIADQPFARVFDETPSEFTLNANQLLAYSRIRYCYPTQSNRREKNALNLLVKLMPKAVQKLTSGERDEIIAELASRTSLETSYDSIDEIMNDFRLRNISVGNTINGRNFSQLPYLDQSGELIYQFESYSTQAKKLVYGLVEEE